MQPQGSRAYFAIRGGFPEIPLYMGSKSTFAAGKFGGVQVRTRSSSQFEPSDLLLPGPRYRRRRYNAPLSELCT